MNIHKRQSIQKLVVEQVNSERLILNDLILGSEGAELVAQLIPQYHPNLIHLQIKGNNIDSEGFQAIFMALMHCPSLCSIQAEWNNIGSSFSGLAALNYLLSNLRFVEYVDLKNNKINHTHAQILAQIIGSNYRALSVIDLRWNDIGEIGAQCLYPALAQNSQLKSILLQDNRISHNTLVQFAQLMDSRGKQVRPRVVSPSATVPNFGRAGNQTVGPAHLGNQTTAGYFPISLNEYPSMQQQALTAQIRGKIDSEQQQTTLLQQKLQLEIQKVMNKIRTKGAQIHDSSTRLSALQNEAVSLTNQLHQMQRLLNLEKQKFMSSDVALGEKMSAFRNEKYHHNANMQAMMEKTVQRQQRQLDDLNGVMEQKHQRLLAYARERINEKRINRNKLVQIKEDIIKFKIHKENLWDKLSTTLSSSNDMHLAEIEEALAKAENAVKTQRKKGEYLVQELNNYINRGLKRQQKMQKDIFQLQNKIKKLHKQMTLANVQMEDSSCKGILLDAQIVEKDADIQFKRGYINFIQSQNGLSADIERLKNDEDLKAIRLAQQTVEMRIEDCVKALRQQQAQNKMIKNHYEKMVTQLEQLTKSTIQAVIFRQ